MVSASPVRCNMNNWGRTATLSSQIENAHRICIHGTSASSATVLKWGGPNLSGFVLDGKEDCEERTSA